MGDVVFVRTRHVYDSYVDIISLAALSGFDLCYPDEIDADDASKVYVLLTRNGEYNADGWPDAKARIVHFNLEWDAYPPLAGVVETWSPDRWFASTIGARYVPVGSHRDLNLQPDATLPHEYDAATLSYLTFRRGWLVNQLSQHIRISPNAWNPERDVILRKSRSMLNIHQRDDAPCVAAQRFALAAAYRLPVITETLADAGLFDHTTILQSDYGNLVEFAQMWLCRNDGHMLQEWGERLHYLLCVENTFEKCVNAAV